MQTSETTLVGNITEISGGQLVATLLTEAEGFEPVVKIGSETLSVGQLGSQLLIKHRHINILGQVLRMWEDPPEEFTTDSNRGSMTGALQGPPESAMCGFCRWARSTSRAPSFVV
ncbi:hypothetical protein [Thiolapillus sp.]|uniref:hypothetical protein n=1 Tax=Thiolapillus sp. TaxID=2017437 RepID=UPI0025D777C9|nr:hypothetical protein [Thiolapillus sp.]